MKFTCVDDLPSLDVLRHPLGNMHVHLLEEGRVRPVCYQFRNPFPYFESLDPFPVFFASHVVFPLCQSIKERLADVTEHTPPSHELVIYQQRVSDVELVHSN